MAAGPKTLKGFASWFATEKRVGDRLPYDRLLDDRTIVMRDGSLMQSIYLEGFAFETADTEEVNHRQIIRAAALRAIGSSRFVLYHHIIRRRVSVGLNSTFDDPVCNLIQQRWQNKLSSRQLFVNDLFITVVRRNPKGKVGFAESLADMFGRGMGENSQAAGLARDHKELQGATEALLAALQAYGPRILSGYETANGRCSEPLELLSAIYNGEMRPVLRPATDLGQYIPYRRVSFGLEAMEQSSLGNGKDFAAIMSLKDYPPHATPGMCDAILRLPFEMVLTESFGFVDRQIGLERINLALRRMRAADEEAMSLRQGLMSAKDDLSIGAMGLGEHHMSLLVRAKSMAQLDPAVAQSLAALADLGAVAVREDVNLEPAFWAQFPGNEGYIARKALISTGAYSSFASLHGFPIGQPEGNHWGQAVCIFETSSGTPYYFNFHKADLGNFTVIGPSGSGKTVVLNFLAAQSQKFKPRTVLFDKDRGAEIFIRSIGGHYATLRPGEPTGFNPLQLPDNAGNRAFLRSLIAQLIVRPDLPLNSEEEAIISEAVDANFDQEPRYRRLRFFRELLGGVRRPTHGDLAARFNPWVGEGEHAWLFDNAEDELDMETRTLGFDMTLLLNEPTLRTPCMMYLFQRVEERLDGTPALIIIDEGWKALDDEVFAAAIRNWMKTLRKRNAILGFGTQSARDALDSRISSAIIEQAATQIFMPNPRAQEEDYCVGFGLTLHELDLIRALPASSRAFLIKHGNHSVVARLDLGAMPDILTVLSGRESSVRQLDELRAQYGDAPADWWPHLLGQPYPGSVPSQTGRL
ncbi:VirB4 family type IV secretion/conjugal transfer ATPase [Asticcacaulis benevestitus]|uniref:Type IV secretion system protein virB4 n=1 Tax=Asticcacaulis benevestitus DSM 16100 = ATCC BAA-896 TaxID=1121022 RepID=V4Q983_9CAUL|nr:VirB4 family type IV secretion/conjugal transfer ATPase [Asticcacaulis benevestitus]ESQ94425.1 type VI secretion protein [Asticcacaulis benevestitus DSM 16100 = ATCC BAA-896]